MSGDRGASDVIIPDNKLSTVTFLFIGQIIKV